MSKLIKLANLSANHDHGGHQCGLYYDNMGASHVIPVIELQESCTQCGTVQSSFFFFSWKQPK